MVKSAQWHRPTGRSAPGSRGRKGVGPCRGGVGPRAVGGRDRAARADSGTIGYAALYAYAQLARETKGVGVYTCVGPFRPKICGTWRSCQVFLAESPYELVNYSLTAISRRTPRPGFGNVGLVSQRRCSVFLGARFVGHGSERGPEQPRGAPRSRHQRPNAMSHPVVSCRDASSREGIPWPRARVGFPTQVYMSQSVRSMTYWGARGEAVGMSHAVGFFRPKICETWRSCQVFLPESA